MNSVVTAPYGSWTSPISAASLASSGHPVTGGAFAPAGEGNAEVWWAESRPEENGRTAIRRWDGARAVDVLPPPWDARTRVHEYGGGAWCIAPDGALVFSNYADQRLYRLLPGGEPAPLSPADAAMRFADMACVVIGNRPGVLCVRETHLVGDDGAPTGAYLPPGVSATARGVGRDICLVPLDGSAATDLHAIWSLAAGTDFLAWPRLSPAGTRLAWIGWDHPNMPWDITTLFVAPVPATGGPALGEQWASGAAYLQPQWRGEELLVLADTTGWWNLYRLREAGDPRPITLLERDLGGPAWQLGRAWYQPLDDGRTLAVSTLGTDRLEILGEAPFDLPFTSIALGEVRGGEALAICAGPTIAPGLRRIDLATGQWHDVRLGIDELPSCLPTPRAVTFESGERDVHAFYYPPTNPGFTAPDGELPPAIAFVHGGPTSHVAGTFNIEAAYFTSRGIGVLDVNYGGSTGYGREYRNRLRGEWGKVDVEDTVAALQGLADIGLADPERLAIRGGSAGGWTVLACLTMTDAFACGASYYGVADLGTFVADTHDFESRYLDSLIGPYPQRADLYEQRAPVNHVETLSCPVLLLQGLADPIVPPNQAEAFARAMAAKHIPYAYLTFEGESHGFRKAETIRRSVEAELSFYGQVMGFEPPGVPRLELVR